MKPEAEALLLKIAQDVAALPERYVRGIGPILIEARLEMQKKLRDWMARHPKEARFTTAMYSDILKQLQKSFVIIAQAHPELLRLLRDGTHAAGRLSMDHLQREAQGLALAHGAEIPILPLKAAAILASGDKLGTRQAQLAKRWSLGIPAEIRRKLAVGLVQGENLHQLANRISPKDPTGDGMGKAFARRAYTDAERIVRTELVAAYNVQANEGIKQAADGDEEFKRLWSGALDARICIICRRLDGQKVGMKQKFTGGLDIPPAHPRCRCSVCLWHADWDEDRPRIEPEIPAPPPKPAPVQKVAPVVVKAAPKPPEMPTGVKGGPGLVTGKSKTFPFQAWVELEIEGKKTYVKAGEHKTREAAEKFVNRFRKPGDLGGRFGLPGEVRIAPGFEDRDTFTVENALKRRSAEKTEEEKAADKTKRAAADAARRQKEITEGRARAKAAAEKEREALAREAKKFTK